MRGGGLRDEAFFRLGAAVLGLFVGLVLGALLFTPLALASVVATPLPNLLAACAVSGAAVGALVPGTAVLAFEGVTWLFYGAMAAVLGGEVPSSEDAPLWLRALFWVAILYLGGIWLCMLVYP
jgi:hypothetical protein